MKQLTVKTLSRCQMIDITASVSAVVREAKVKSGLCHVFVPHTSAAVTINENADPDVPADILSTLARIIPKDGGYRHREGNADAHVKASLVGAAETIIINEGRLVLGAWQAIFFCEFDGPRTRQVLVEIIPAT